MQEWVPLKQIFSDGIVEIANNAYIKILEVVPINYNLKSDL